MTASTAAGTEGRTRRTDGGSPAIILATIVCAVAPVKGGSPVSISYSTAPSEYTSVRPVSVRSAEACSGLMYWGVPTAMPASVSAPPADAGVSAHAIPKSATIA